MNLQEHAAAVARHHICMNHEYEVEPEDDHCDECGQLWPCDASRALADAEVGVLLAAVEAALRSRRDDPEEGISIELHEWPDFDDPWQVIGFDGAYKYEAEGPTREAALRALLAALMEVPE